MLWAAGKRPEAVAAWTQSLDGDRDSIDPKAVEAKIARARSRKRSAVSSSHSLLSSCAPKSSDPSHRRLDAVCPITAPFVEALDHCDQVTTVTAEIGLSGKAGTQRLRGTLHTGFAPPESLRLEAVAPFGGPFFLLAGTGGRATLLLPREDRVLRDASASAILEALAGLDQTPSDLRAWIVGCPAATATIAIPAATALTGQPPIWRAAARLWIHRVPASQAVGRTGWRLVAVIAGPLTVEFSEHAGTQPGRVRIRRAATANAAALDVRLALRQVERGVDLADAAFAIDVPANAVPITIEELRGSGPSGNQGATVTVA